jgi:DNA polymerase-1
MNRAFYAIRDLVTKDGIHTNAVYGFFNMMFRLLEEFEPTHMSVAFDLKAPTFRHKEYKEYKGTRKGMSDELAMQFPIVKEIIDAMGLHRMELEGFEADDLIGTIASLSADEGMEVIVVTGDKDALQLVNENINILFTKKGISNVVRYTTEEIQEEFELSPLQIVDYKGLSGDASDNIPGIPGIGPKTAKKLLHEFGTVENLIANVEEIKNKRHKTLVEEYSTQALMSKRLATIITTVPVEFYADEFEVSGFDYDKLRELLSKYELKSLLKRIAQKAASETNQITMDLDGVITTDTEHNSNIRITFVDDEKTFSLLEKDIRKAGKISIYSIYDKKDITNDGIVGISISTSGEQNYFVDKSLLLNLKDILEDENVKKCGYDMKRDILICMQHDIEYKGIWFDVAIAQYLLEPGRAKYSLADLAYEHLNAFIPSVEDLIGKGAKSIKYGNILIHK